MADNGEESSAEGPITIKVKEAGGEEMCFKVKKTTKMEKIFQAYCQRRGVDLKSVRFMFDGQRVQPDETPKMLELQESDQIDAMIEAVGGNA